MDWKTWSPFQSAKTREVCAHLTPGERAMLMERSRRYGKWCAFTFAIPLSFAIVAWFNFGRSLPTWALWVAAVPVIVHIVAIPYWRRSQRRFLNDSEWAVARRAGGPAAA